MAWIKAYFDGFSKILSAHWWPPSLLSTCPKVIISRLIADDGGDRGKKPVTQRPECHNFQANTSDDGGDRDRGKTPVTQSSRFGFLNLNYSAFLQQKIPIKVPINSP